ncbi:hypothetical protein COB55_00550 [Candidatus Wolfebacteria bacterium]|nr:MAG: hypothetical protein COB55_00550 [Candidatus Wolfebacteria bacterium]
MTTKDKVVTDDLTGRKPTDGEIVTFTKRTNELTNRFLKGALCNQRVLDSLQKEIEFGWNIIDCDVPVFIPEGWNVLLDEVQLPNRVLGKIKLNKQLTDIIELFISEQQKGDKVINGNKLREILKDKRVYTAHVLDYLLENTRLIPEEWKEKTIFFWGTIYLRAGDGRLYVRCLGWRDDRWSWSCYRLVSGWNAGHVSAVSAS